MSGAPLLMTENSSSLADVHRLPSGRSIWEYMDGCGGGAVVVVAVGLRDLVRVTRTKE